MRETWRARKMRAVSEQSRVDIGASSVSEDVAPPAGDEPRVPLPAQRGPPEYPHYFVYEAVQEDENCHAQLASHALPHGSSPLDRESTLSRLAGKLKHEECLPRYCM